MKCGLALCFGVGFWLLPVAANQETPTALAKRLATEASQAVVKGNFRRLAELTYPAVLKEAGGSDQMIAVVEKAMQQLKAQGFTFESTTVGEPGPILTEGLHSFIVVPTTNIMRTPNGKLQSKSYLLGISTDNGKSWTFVDGTGIANQKQREKMLPKLPAKLVLPERQQPTLLKDKE